MYWVSAGATAAYAALFLCAAPNRSLRLSRLTLLSLAVLAASRLGSLFVGSPLNPARDSALVVALAVVLLTQRQLGRVWLVRTSAADFQQQMETACRGLFLPCQSKASNSPRLRQFMFALRDESTQLRSCRICAKLQCLVLPSSGVHGKIALFNSWLAKQYPGPIPKIKIVLGKKERIDA